MMELSRLSAKFEENVLDATNAWSHHVTDRGQLAGINRGHPRAGAAAGAGQRLRRLAVRPGPADLCGRGDRRASRRRCAARSTRPGRPAPRTRAPAPAQFDNTAVMEDILRLRHEAAQLLDFSSYAEYALANRMARTVPEVIGLPARAGARGQAGRRRGVRRARAVRRPQAQRLGRHLLFRAAAAEPLLGLAGGAARVPAAAAGARGPVRSGGEAVRRAHPRAQRRAGVASRMCATSRCRRPAVRAVASFYLDAYARPHKRSGAWMDDCVGRKALSGQHHPAGGLPGLQFAAARGRAAGAAHAR